MNQINCNYRSKVLWLGPSGLGIPDTPWLGTPRLGTPRLGTLGLGTLTPGLGISGTPTPRLDHSHTGPLEQLKTTIL